MQLQTNKLPEQAAAGAAAGADDYMEPHQRAVPPKPRQTAAVGTKTATGPRTSLCSRRRSPRVTRPLLDGATRRTSVLLAHPDAHTSVHTSSSRTATAGAVAKCTCPGQGQGPGACRPPHRPGPAASRRIQCEFIDANGPTPWSHSKPASSTRTFPTWRVMWHPKGFRVHSKDNALHARHHGLRAI